MLCRISFLIPTAHVIHYAKYTYYFKLYRLASTNIASSLLLNHIKTIVLEIKQIEGKLEEPYSSSMWIYIKKYLNRDGNPFRRWKQEIWVTLLLKYGIESHETLSKKKRNAEKAHTDILSICNVHHKIFFYTFLILFHRYIFSASYIKNIY